MKRIFLLFIISVTSLLTACSGPQPDRPRWDAVIASYVDDGYKPIIRN